MAGNNDFYDRLFAANGVTKKEVMPTPEAKPEIPAPLGEEDFWKQMVKPEVPQGHRLAEMDEAQLTRLRETGACWPLLGHVAASVVS